MARALLVHEVDVERTPWGGVVEPLKANGTIADFRTGDRVELRTAPDARMAGDRYGEVQAITSRHVIVRLDESRRLFRTAPGNLTIMDVAYPRF